MMADRPAGAVCWRECRTAATSEVGSLWAARQAAREGGGLAEDGRGGLTAGLRATRLCAEAYRAA